MIKGLDILGLCRHDIRMLKRVLPRGIATGSLYGTFGDDISPLTELLNTGKIAAHREHLSNGPCARSNRCEWKNEILAHDYKALANRAAHFESLARRFPNTHFYLSPRLEHDEEKNVVDRWLQVLHDNAPHCRVVISAVSGYRPSNVLGEYHGNHAHGHIISNDSDHESLFDAPRGWENGGSILSLGWIFPFNGNKKGGPFIPPSKRRVFATESEVKRCLHILGL